MLTVAYEKQEVLKSWLSLPVDKRKELLTFTHSELITIVNLINTSLVLTAKESQKNNYEILESIDTYWVEPYSMQIKPSLLKGQKLVKMLESQYPDFLLSPKVLYTDLSEYRKLFDPNITTWEQFQLAICKLIEQAFLLSHFNRLSQISSKAAKELLKKVEKPDRKNKEDAWFDPKQFIIEIESDISTDIDEKDLTEMLLFDINCLGGRSHRLRKYYANISIDLDDELGDILHKTLYDTHPFEVLDYLPIVAYYDSSLNKIKPN